MRQIAGMATQYVPCLHPLYSGKRSSGRVRLGIGARLETVAGTYPCTVRDVSSGGAHICGPRLRSGQSVILTIEGREIFGDVVWVREASAGVLFQPPVEHEFVVALRHNAPVILTRAAQENEDFARNWVAGLTGEN